MPSSREKIVAYHISRLNDKRAEVKLEAITELATLGVDAETALDALKKCYEEDDDPVVSQAAQKAGLLIYRQVREAKSNPS